MSIAEGACLIATRGQYTWGGGREKMAIVILKLGMLMNLGDNQSPSTTKVIGKSVIRTAGLLGVTDSLDLHWLLSH